MKSTEFVTRWHRLTGTTSGTNCPRCGFEISVLAMSIHAGQKIICEGCHNKAVATDTSLIWNYAHEGREGLGEAVARSEPRTPPKHAPRPKFDESELDGTRAWMGATGRLKKIDLHDHVSDALVGARHPEKKPPGAFEIEALEAMATDALIALDAAIINVSHRYVGAEHNGYIAKCPNCNRPQLVVEIDHGEQTFECAYCDNAAKMETPIRGEFKDWPLQIKTIWHVGATNPDDDTCERDARGAISTDGGCELCEAPVAHNRDGHQVRVCDSCERFHGRALMLGNAAKECAVHPASLIYDPDFEGAEPGTVGTGEYFAECPYCGTHTRQSATYLQEKRIGSNDCPCGAVIHVVEPMDDTAARKVPVRWVKPYAEKKTKRRRASKPFVERTEAEPLCFNTADELMGLFRKPR